MNTLQGSFGRLFKSAGIIFLSTVLARGLALGAEVAIIRALSPSVFGTITVAYTISLILSRLSLFGVPQGVTRYISENTDEQNQRLIAKQGLIIILPPSLVLSLSIFIFRGSFSDLLGNNNIAQYLGFFTIFVFAFSVARVAIAVLRARGETTMAVVSKDLLPRIGGFLLFVGLTSFGATELGAVAYWASLPVISLLLVVYFLNRRLGALTILKKPIRKQTIIELWSFSWPLALSSSLVLLFSNMDIIMIEYFLRSKQTGYYRSIQPLRQITEFVLSSFVFLYLPIATRYFSSDNIEGLSHMYKFSAKWVTTFSIPLVLVFSVFADDVIRTFYGSTYLPASDVLTVLVTGLFFNVLVGLNGATAKAIDRPQIDLVSAFSGFVVNLGLNIILIPRYGIIGAATATVIGYIAFNTLEVVLIYQSIGSHPFSANQLKPIFPTVGVALLLKHVAGDNSSLLALLGIGILLSISQLISMRITRSFDENDLDMARQIETRMDKEIPYLRYIIEKLSGRW